MSNFANGTCTFEFKNGEWTVITDACQNGCVCAQPPASPTGVAGAQVTTGSKFTDQEFRGALKDKNKGVAVIPDALAPADGTTFTMDCVTNT